MKMNKYKGMRTINTPEIPNKDSTSCKNQIIGS